MKRATDQAWLSKRVYVPIDLPTEGSIFHLTPTHLDSSKFHANTGRPFTSLFRWSGYKFDQTLGKR